MKRTLCIAFALLFVIMLGGCSAKDKEVSSGIYYCKGDYEQYKTPYVWVDTSDGFFTMVPRSSRICGSAISQNLP